MFNASETSTPPTEFADGTGAADRIAGFWRRLAAGCLDLLILGIIGQAVGWTFSSFWFGVGPYGRFVGFFFILSYFGLMNSELGKGQTLGKRVLGIRVRDNEGKKITLGRSLTRTTILSVPFILNGWALPILQNPVISSILTVVIFGIGGATIYMMVFNRGARQGLHDLICNTYVVNLGEDPLAISPQTNNLHKVIAGIIVAASVILVIVGGIITSGMTSASPYGFLYSTYSTLQSDPRFFSASVFDNTFYSGGAKPSRTLRVNVWYRGVPNKEEFDSTINDVAKVVLENMENIDDFDLVEISVTSAYDLGIASGQYTSGDRQTPQIWRERVGLAYSSSSRSASMTERSSSVVTSPATLPLVASSRSSRRMILPDRVLGNASVNRMSSGLASEPISLAT